MKLPESEIVKTEKMEVDGEKMQKELAAKTATETHGHDRRLRRPSPPPPSGQNGPGCHIPA